MQRIAFLAGVAFFAAALGAVAAEAPQSSPKDADPLARLCDAAGVGYVLVPGTTTCVKVSGFIRMDVRGFSDRSPVPAIHSSLDNDH